MDDVQNMDLPTMSRTIKIVDGTKRLYIVECAMIIEQRLKEERESRPNYMYLTRECKGFQRRICI
jgi:hypothetical protein